MCPVIPVIDNIKAYNEASVVFFGTVIKAYEPYKQDSEISSQEEYTTFAVHYIFKGSLDENKVTTNSGTSIEYDGFVVGGTYFVYAYGPTNAVSVCTAPVILPHALPILIFHFLFLLIPIGIIAGIVVAWKKRK